MSMRINFALAVCVCAEEYLANKHRIEHLYWIHFCFILLLSSLPSFTHEVNNSKIGNCEYSTVSSLLNHYLI